MLEVLTSIIVAAFTGYVTFKIQEDRLKKELKTEFMAEKVVASLLTHEKWKQRSFSAIKKRLGGFQDDELRKILVRSGAVCFQGQDNKELWGLIEKNEALL